MVDNYLLADYLFIYNNVRGKKKYVRTAPNSHKGAEKTVFLMKRVKRDSG